MAAGKSGTVEFTRSGGNYGTQKLRFTWSETISGNKSTVSISKVEFYSSSYGGYDCLGYFVLEVNGQDLLTLNGNGSVRISLNTYKEMSISALPVSSSAISHAADGTKTVTVKLKKLPSGGYTSPIVWMAGDVYGTGQLPISFPFTDGDQKTIDLTKLPISTLSISAGQNTSIKVKRNGTALANGTPLYAGDALTVTAASTASGYRLASLTVGGSSFTSGGVYNVAAGVPGTLAVVSAAEAYEASTATLSGNTMGSPVTITVNPANSSFTHTVEWSYGGESGTLATKSSQTSFSFTPPCIGNKNSETLTVTVKTYSGSTQVGQTTSAAATIYVPSDAAPTVSAGWIVLGHANTSDMTQAGITNAVKGYSTLRFTLDLTKVSFKYSASLKQIKVTYGSTVITKTAAGTYSIAIINAVTNTVQVVLTDTRDKTVTGSFSLTAYDYAGPQLSGITVRRSDDQGQAADNGMWLYVLVSGVIASLGGQNGIKSLTAAVKASGGSFGTARNLTSGQADWWNEGLSATSSYTVRLSITDKLDNTAYAEITIPTASVAFNIKEGGNAAAFGKYAETDKALDIGDWTAVGRVMGLGQARASIPSNADLNDYAEPGVYAITSNTIAETLSNKPTDYAGTLRVWNAIANSANPGDTWYYVIQEYTSIYTDTWRRLGQTGSGTTPVWGDWSYYAGQLSVLKSNLGLASSLQSDAKSVSNGGSVEWTFTGAGRGVIIVSSAASNAHEIVIYNCSASLSMTKTQLRNPSGITVTASGGVLTIANSSGVYIYCMHFHWT